MPKLTKKPPVRPAIPLSTVEPPTIVNGVNVSPFAWAQNLFALFGKEKLIDGPEGQDALYIAVKMSPADRALLLTLLGRLVGKK